MMAMDWDLQSALGDGDLHDEQFLPLCKGTGSSPDSSQASTGYLQDAVAEWSGRGKRRRLSSTSLCSPLLHGSAAVPPPVTSEELRDLLLRGFWDSSCCGDPTILHLRDGNVIFHDVDEKSHAFSSEERDDLGHQSKPAKALPSQGIRMKEASVVAYPFAVVKPGGGDEGGVTLDDINARLLMRPRRPVRHPVGEYALGGRRRRLSPAGPGLSGRAVVSLSRIQTQGRGTITIIRTK